MSSKRQVKILKSCLAFSEEYWRDHVNRPRLQKLGCSQNKRWPMGLANKYSFLLSNRPEQALRLCPFDLASEETLRLHWLQHTKLHRARQFSMAKSSMSLPDWSPSIARYHWEVLMWFSFSYCRRCGVHTLNLPSNGRCLGWVSAPWGFISPSFLIFVSVSTIGLFLHVRLV